MSRLRPGRHQPRPRVSSRPGRSLAPHSPAEALAPTHGSSSGIRSINHKAICKMTRRRGRRLIFAECAAATCDNARVECARASGSYTGCRERNTGICVRCHGAHNRCDCRANLLRCYGDGNLAEGGRADRKRGVGFEKKEINKQIKRGEREREDAFTTSNAALHVLPVQSHPL